MRPLPTILHVDMDAFYASVEQLQDPSLRNKPVIVGGDGRRGVVASCSYEARFFGIRSAMPASRAKRLCPQAIFVPGHFWLYEEYSHKMHRIFQAYTPLIEGISLDEAFLDVGGAVRLFGQPHEIAHSIRERIFAELGLWVSVGAATTKHLAKLASNAAKPTASATGPTEGRGVIVIEDRDSVEFLHALPVSAIWGVGPATSDKLAKLGVTTVKQLANIPVPVLAMSIGKATAEHLHSLAWNRDDRDVIVEREAKSVGHEQTFPRDIHSEPEVHAKLARLADAVASRMRDSQVKGRTVTTKVRFGSFETITRARSVDDATSNANAILALAREVTDGIDFSVGVRLLGISVSKLEPALIEDQLALENEADDARLDTVIDEIRHKFGVSSVASAHLLSSKGVNVLRRGERQWGPNDQDG